MTLLFILFLLASVSCQFIPDPRQYQASVLVGTRVIILGGYTGKPEYTNETIVLDLSKSFDISHPPWSINTKGAAPVNAEFGTACLSPVDNSTIYIIGGVAYKTSLEFVKPSLIYVFNSAGSSWTTLNASGFAPFADNTTNVYNDMQAIMRHDLIYIFSGTNTLRPIESNLTTNSTLLQTLNILNTKTQAWMIFNFSNTPSPREGYTATLLKNGYILYIGGTEKFGDASKETNVNLNNIPIFDTDDLTWTSMTAVGDTVEPRNSHSAVLTEDGKIIIYGGQSGYGFVKVSPNLAILDTNSVPYKWTILTNISTANEAPAMAGHSSILYNHYMIIIFGRKTTNQLEIAYVPSLNNQLYIFDTKKYAWVTNFTPSSGQRTTSCIIGIVSAIISVLVANWILLS
ncbi:5295_t:CDS:2 [Cetraspora pellucida]|uniref:5295_t:CDS:1 n=1 Tax=Cetraspora pellucida TaxID=1433469 RepID=A0A9N9H3I2_9GLOM|nr:5295_t:CDS:2 [Cetraspora pellucida]